MGNYGSSVCLFLFILPSNDLGHLVCYYLFVLIHSFIYWLVGSYHVEKIKFHKCRLVNKRRCHTDSFQLNIEVTGVLVYSEFSVRVSSQWKVMGGWLSGVILFPAVLDDTGVQWIEMSTSPKFRFIFALVSWINSSLLPAKRAVYMMLSWLWVWLQEMGTYCTN